MHCGGVNLRHQLLLAACCLLHGAMDEATWVRSRGGTGSAAQEYPANQRQYMYPSATSDCAVTLCLTRSLINCPLIARQTSHPLATPSPRRTHSACRSVFAPPSTFPSPHNTTHPSAHPSSAHASQPSASAPIHSRFLRRPAHHNPLLRHSSRALYRPSPSYSWSSLATHDVFQIPPLTASPIALERPPKAHCCRHHKPPVHVGTGVAPPEEEDYRIANLKRSSTSSAPTDTTLPSTRPRTRVSSKTPPATPDETRCKSRTHPPKQ